MALSVPGRVGAQGVDTMLWLMTAQDGVVESGKFYNLRKPTDF